MSEKPIKRTIKGILKNKDKLYGAPSPAADVEVGEEALELGASKLTIRPSKKVVSINEVPTVDETYAAETKPRSKLSRRDHLKVDFSGSIRDAYDSDDYDSDDGEVEDKSDGMLVRPTDAIGVNRITGKVMTKTVIPEEHIREFDVEDIDPSTYDRRPAAAIDGSHRPPAEMLNYAQYLYDTKALPDKPRTVQDIRNAALGRIEIEDPEASRRRIRSHILDEYKKSTEAAARASREDGDMEETVFMRGEIIKSRIAPKYQSMRDDALILPADFEQSAKHRLVQEAAHRIGRDLARSVARDQKRFAEQGGDGTMRKPSAHKSSGLSKKGSHRRGSARVI